MNIDKLLIMMCHNYSQSMRSQILNNETAEIIFLKFHLSLMHKNLC